MRRLYFLGLACIIAFVHSAFGQQNDELGDVVLNMTPRAVWGNLSSTVTFAIYGRTSASESVTGSNPTIGTPSDMPQISSRLIPGVTYTAQFSVQTSGQPSNGNPPQFGAVGCRLTAFAPPGYTLQMRQNSALPFRPMTQFDWSFQNLLSQTYGVSVQIRVVGPTADPGVGPGMATALRPAWTPWQLSLGALQNGLSAGTVSFNLLSSTNSFATTFTRSNLTCDATGSDVLVLGDSADSNVLRQIIAPQVCVDISGALTSGNIQINCYHPSQRSADVDGTGYFTFTGSPFAAYTVQPGGSDAAGVTISCDTRDTTGSAVGAVARTLTTSLTRTGTAPAYTWTAAAWHTGATAPIQTVRSRTGSTETIDVRNDSAVVAVKSTRTYSSMLLDEEITSEQTGTTNAVTATHDYYATDSTSTSYGWPKTTSLTGGGWQGFEYAGATRTVHAAWQDVSSAGFPSESAAKTAVTLTPDAFGQLTRASSSTTTITGTTTAQSSTTYTNTTPFSSFSTHPGLIVVEAAQSDSSSSSASLTTKTSFFIENAGDTTAYPSGPASDDFYRGQVYSVERPDKVKQAFVYQRGTWNGTTFTTSPNSGLDGVMADNVTPAAASRTMSITGTADSSLVTVYTSSDSYPVATVYLVDKKSTREIAIRDNYADLVYTETQVWANSTWNVVSSTSYTYNLAHQLTNSTSSNGAIWSANYSGERKTDETDASGIKLSYTYDAADRVDTVTREAAGTITALATKFVYDAAGHVTQQTVGYGQAETIVSSRIYDDAGRVTSESAPGPNGSVTTSYAYDPTSSQVTITLPNGGTRIENYYADGSPKQVTGTAVVAQYFASDIPTGGGGHAKVNFGSSTSTRFRETWSDWLGRGTKTSRPGFSGTAQPAVVEQALYDSSTGQLTKSTRTDYANTLYSYDALSRPNRSGLDLGGTVDVLDLTGPDRIADADQYFEYLNSAWWVTKVAKTYPITGTNSSTAVTVSTTRQRLTGFSGNLQSETSSTDADNNTTTRTVSVSRGTATTTSTTTTSGITNSLSETYLNGLPISTTGADALTYTFGYDALSRRSTAVDPRTGTSTTHYKLGSGAVDYVVDAASKRVAAYTYDSAGRVIAVGIDEGLSTYYTYTAYNKMDQVVQRWGSGTYAVEYAYNTYGEMVAQRTFRDNTLDFTGTAWPLTDSGIDSRGNPTPSGWTNGDKTTWSYDTPSGLLTSKTDAAGKAVSYTYNDRGQTATRSWARHVGNNASNPLLTTTYDYYTGTGELSTITYNDTATTNPTSPVTYAYTRSGQIDSVTDGVTGQRSFVYNASQPLRLDAVSLPGFYGNRVLTRSYDGVYRPNGFKLGDTTRGLTADLTQTHSYDAVTGRFTSIATNNSQLSNTFTYGYETSSSLVKTVNAGSFTATRTFEAHRNLLTSIDSKWSTASRTRYDYTYNDRALRDSIKQSGDAFADFGGSTYYRPVYNGRGELVDSADYLGEDATSTGSPQLSGRHFAYAYDNLGNRVTASRTGTAGTPDHFTPNSLNQYISRENNVAHAAGTAQTASVVTANGTNGATFSTVARQGSYWDAQANLSNTSGPASSTFTITATLAGSPTLARTDATHTAYLPPALQSFTHDEDGNLTLDGVWNYNYDAENRLISMTTTTGAIGAGFRNRTLEFKYDYLGRRVQKRSTDATAGTDVYRRYLYDGDNLVAEFDATSTTCGNPVRSYTWGLDLAGSLSATGGVGALLQIHDYAGAGTDYLPTYDGNGNVAALLKASDGTMVAAYEYSPFGELLRCEGSYAKSNPFRFSTKFTDDETGLVYYGARYFSPSLGRFLNRDPIAEAGGLNLYGFCGNDGVNRTDFLGNRSWLSSLWNRTIGSLGKHIAQNWDHGRNYVIMAAAIVASIWVGWEVAEYVSSALNATTMTVAASGAVTVTATGSGLVSASLAAASGTIGGIVGGAAGGFVGGATMSAFAGQNGGQILNAGLKGAAAGAIMGGIGGYYGKTWSLARVGVTATGGGVASEITGGRFRDGALIAGTIAGLTYLNHLAREYEWAHSPPEAKTGESSGLDEDGYKLGGGRPKLTYDQNGNAILTRDIAPFGGDQGSNPGRFILPAKSAAAWYSSGSLRDIVVESFAGVHDFLGHPWTYNSAGYQNVSGSLFGGAITRVFGSGTANVVANVMTAVDIPLAAPFAVAPHLMYFGNLDPRQ